MLQQFMRNSQVLMHSFALLQGAAHLFMPRLPEVYAVWMGPLKGPEDFKKK